MLLGVTLSPEYICLNEPISQTCPIFAKMIACGICKQEFETTDSFKTHLILHRNKGEFPNPCSCGQNLRNTEHVKCMKTFNDLKSLLRHIKLYHSYLLNNEPAAKHTKNTWKDSSENLRDESFAEAECGDFDIPTIFATTASKKSQHAIPNEQSTSSHRQFPPGMF